MTDDGLLTRLSSILGLRGPGSKYSPDFKRQYPAPTKVTRGLLLATLSTFIFITIYLTVRRPRPNRRTHTPPSRLDRTSELSPTTTDFPPSPSPPPAPTSTPPPSPPNRPTHPHPHPPKNQPSTSSSPPPAPTPTSAKRSSPPASSATRRRPSSTGTRPSRTPRSSKAARTWRRSTARQRSWTRLDRTMTGIWC